MSGAHCLAAPGRGEGIQTEVRQHYSGRLAGVGRGHLCRLVFTSNVT